MELGCLCLKPQFGCKIVAWCGNPVASYLIQKAQLKCARPISYQGSALSGQTCSRQASFKVSDGLWKAESG